jgi:phenylpropionate dioxygenase-like ring-hydroxylating dioxygenase large terminal subunit
VSDATALRHCWHPVAYAAEVGAAPRTADLLGRPLVLWREQPDHVMQEFERVIFAQDQRVAESQRPEAVPFDLAVELHLRFDTLAVAYRRAMRAHGLA